MKVLIDTNILLSASLNPSGVPYQAYVKAVTHPNYGFITDQNIDELRRVFNRKFPHKIPALERFLALVLTVVEVVQTPVGGIADEVLVRDASDRPILRAAVAAHVDILITGDKDFLEAGITTPHIMTAREFVQMDEW